MDPQISSKIHVTVIDILISSDIDTLTEQQVRHLASQKLNIDLSHLSYKILVRQIIEGYLLSLPAPEQEHEQKPLFNDPASSRIICKLSQKKKVAVRSDGGETVVSIGELPWNDGKPKLNCIDLLPDQWSTIRKSFPAIEEAIAKVESRLRSQFENNQAGGKHNSFANRSKQNGAVPITKDGADPLNKDGALNKPRVMATGERPTDATTVASTPQRLVPMEIIRFDGKNYQQWADRMESYLNQLKVAYVLSEPCPSAVGVVDRELRQTILAAEKWMDDDHVCHQNILNSLCDNLFQLYSKKSGTAKELWVELKLIYLHEEHGAKVSLVRKYIDFQILEGKSVFDQVHEFNQIADALVASGMYVEEKFHVNVIISKLPPSWKPYSVQLMKEDHLPVWMLMNHLKAEEESLKGTKCQTRVSRADTSVFQPSKNLAPNRTPMKKAANSHTYHESDRDKKLKFCGICKKKGHNPEQCWFRNSGGKDAINEKDFSLSEMTIGEDCGICKKKGHNSEQCWFRSSVGKDAMNEKDNPLSDITVGEDNCGICKKKGHNSEQCWFRTSRGKDAAIEKDNLTSVNGFAVEDTNRALNP